MRRPSKNFTVEVKRRNARTSPASVFAEPVAHKSVTSGGGGTASSLAAEAYFRIPAEATKSAAEENIFKKNADEIFSAGAGGRVLPCLVTEAFVSVADVAGASGGPAPVRKRGRPRKERAVEAALPVLPRKRGRPRKQPGDPVKVPSVAIYKKITPVAEEKAARSAAVVTDHNMWHKTSRQHARTLSAQSLPRGERWRRRLPKILW